MFYKTAVFIYNINMLKIKSVQKGSVFDELGIKSGYYITHFCGYEAQDVLDLTYYGAQSKLSVTVKSPTETLEFDIEKDDYEELGVELESDNLNTKTCQNNCIFCFIDQMPKGERQTLYVKDDDYRESFLFGNYVTLTNLSQADLERIVRLKLSPLYVSVHATNGEVRKKMLNNRFADRICSQLQFLSDGGIEIHAQVVLVAGVNDGEVLRQTVTDLKSISGVQTVAVVPCGITKFREGLFPIKDITKEYAQSVIDQIKTLNTDLCADFCFPADEFYIRAEKPFESADVYGDFNQIGNGVGMVNAFAQDFDAVAERAKNNRVCLIVTGVSAYPIISEYAGRAMQLISGLTAHVLPVKNHFFGETVTCAGLLTCKDIVRAVRGFDKRFDVLIIPSVMLKNGETDFLDGKTVGDLEKAVGARVCVAEPDGASFFETLKTC